MKNSTYPRLKKAKSLFLFLLSLGLSVGLYAQTTYTVTNTSDSGPGSLRQAILDANNSALKDNIHFNIPGNGPHEIKPTSGRLPYIVNPIIIDATTQPGWTIGSPKIVLDGSETPNDGPEAFPVAPNGLELRQGSDFSEIKGFSIVGFPDVEGRNGFAILILSNNNKIQGNFIGLGPDGESVQSNLRGIQIMGGSDNTIGGFTESERNIIAGNRGIGLAIFGNDPPPQPGDVFYEDNAERNKIIGNYFGTDKTGNIGIPSTRGIQIGAASKYNEITDNIISAGNAQGIFFANPGTDFNVVSRNKIGTNVDGSISLPNIIQGIVFQNGPKHNIVGGDNPEDGNLISGSQFGVALQFNPASPGSISVSENTIKNNIIGKGEDGTGFENTFAGVGVWGMSNQNNITNNRIVGNTSSGIDISNINSNNNLIADNVIGESQTGIFLGSESNNNTIIRNYIGNENNNSLPNTTGISISNASQNFIGGEDISDRNIISGNTGNGVIVSGSNSKGNKIKGNYIGLDSDGSVGNTLGNGQRGILVTNGANENLIESNVISGNSTSGVQLAGASTTNNIIRKNKVGTNPQGNLAIANLFGITISGGTNNLIGGPDANDNNIISGNTQHGIELFGANTKTNKIQYNLIGLNQEGTDPIPNGQRGVFLYSSASENIIENNIISGNSLSGVELNGETTSSNAIRKNKIGVNQSGNEAIANSTGITITQASQNIIGGLNEEDGNLISGNTNNGILITGSTATSNQIRHNIIGMNSEGSTKLANGQRGILLQSGPSQNKIIQNVISGNNASGIELFSADSNQILGNKIGTDITGTAAIGNQVGIFIRRSSSNTIGSNAENDKNIIASNNSFGIFLLERASNNKILGNNIGAGIDGETVLPNGTKAIEILNGSSDNHIGGIGLGEGNLIQSHSKGISLSKAPIFSFGSEDPINNKISGNSIFANTLIGIDLGDNGITPNDPDDADTGPNLFQNFPVLTESVKIESGKIHIKYQVPSSPTNSAYPIQVEFFVSDGNRQGKTYLFSDTYSEADFTSGEPKSIALDIPTGIIFEESEKLTSTATDANGNTSEFGADANITISQNFNLNISTIGEGFVEVSPDLGIFPSGEEVILTAIPTEGWLFIGWDGDLQGDQNPASITMDTDKTVTAVFEEIPVPIYTLTINVEGQGSIFIDPQSDGNEYEEGTVVTLTAIPEDGWQFTSWSGDIVSEVNPESITMDADRSVTANFELIPIPVYTLTTSVTGQGSIVTDPQSDGNEYEEGTVVTLTAIPEDGWQFTSWSGDIDSEVNPESITMDADRSVTANFELIPIPVYTLTTSVTGQGSIVTDPQSDGNEYEEGTVVTLTAIPAEGWRFVEWTEDLTGDNNPANITMDADKSVKATFELIPVPTYTLTTSVAGEGSIEITPQSDGNEYEKETEVTLTAIPAEGWKFIGWTEDLTGDNNPATITMDADKSVTATFELIPVPTYILTTSVAGEGSIEITPQSDGNEYEKETVITLTAIPAEGWKFIGWTEDLTGDNNPETITMDADKSVTATFELIPIPTYTLNTSVVGEGTISIDPVSDGNEYQEGTEVTLTAIPAEGWKFTGWTEDIETDENPATITMDADKSVTAVFEEIPVPVYTLTTQVEGQGSISTDPVGDEFEEGTEVSLTAIPAEGWKFTGWTGNIETDENPATITMDADKSVTAVFEEIPVPVYTLTTQVEGQGSISTDPVGDEFEEGTEVSLTVIPAEGWKFTGWTGDIETDENPAIITMDADKSVTAVFEEIPVPVYTLTTQVEGQGSISTDPVGDEFEEGTEVSLTAIPAEGWEFTGWTGNIESDENPATITMDADKFVTAVFEEIPVPVYTLTTNVVGQGSISTDPVGDELEEGTEVSLTAIPAEGWKFTGWTEGLTSDNNPATIIMDADKSVTATFELIQIPTYTLNTSVVGEGTIRIDPVSDGTEYQEGTEVELTANPEEGWMFDRWTGDVSSESNPLLVTMNSDKNLVANFILLTGEGEEGCSPGFWRNTDGWCGDYKKSDDFFKVFGITNTRGLGRQGKHSLQEAVTANGGGFNKLARHATAALLNACNNGVNYPYSVSNILAAVAEVFNDPNKNQEDANALGDLYDIANNAGCPLNASNNKTSELSFDAHQVLFLQDLKVYPNPLSEEGIWMEFDEINGKQNYHAILYNVIGKPIAEVRFELGNGKNAYFWQWDSKEMGRGVFILNVHSKKKSYQLRLIKE